MKFISRIYQIYPTYNQINLIKKLLNHNFYYKFFNVNYIFFLDEYHEYIRIPQLGDIRIYDYYIRTNYEPRIIKVVLFKHKHNDIIGGEYCLMINSIINKDEELIINILTTLYRKQRQNITLEDVEKIKNQKTEYLEKDIELLKKKMDKISSHSKFYWKMQKQLSKKEMKLMNAKMNTYKEENTLNNNNLVINNNTIMDNLIQKPIKQEIVYVDKNRKFKDIDARRNNNG